MDYGYVPLHRKIFKNPLFVRHPEWVAPFSWLFARCAYQNCTVRLASGGYVELKRGQCAITVREFADAVGAAKSNVETMLEAFEDEGMIVRARTRTRTRTRFGTRDSHPCTLITLCNYEKYQTPSTAAAAKVGQEVGQEPGQEIAQVVDMRGQSVPNHSNHSNHQQKKEEDLFGGEGKGRHEHRRPPREGAVSSDRKTHFFHRDGPNWAAHAADYVAAHGAEPVPDRNGGFWFWIAGEQFRDWKRKPPRRVPNGPGLSTPGIRRAAGGNSG